MLALVLLLTVTFSRPGHIQKREVMSDTTIHPKYKRLYQKSMDSVEEHLQYLHKKGFEEIGPVADPRIVKREPKRIPMRSENELDFSDEQLRNQFNEYMTDFATGMAHDMFHRLYEDMSGTLTLIKGLIDIPDTTKDKDQKNPQLRRILPQR
eukprot:NODE_866_length_3598_cov_0.492426.p1 type:complete len:152 gc:universal NODE_866_length_3598_cov_0.492426:784-1239(+)